MRTTLQTRAGEFNLVNKRFLILTLLILSLPDTHLSATPAVTDTLVEPGYFSKPVLSSATGSLSGKLAFTGLAASSVALVGHFWLKSEIATQSQKVAVLERKQSKALDNTKLFEKLTTQLVKAQKRLDTLSTVHRVIKIGGPLAFTAAVACAALAIKSSHTKQHATYQEKLVTKSSAAVKPATGATVTPASKPSSGSASAPDSGTSLAPALPESNPSAGGSGDVEVDAAIDKAIKLFVDSNPERLAQPFDEELRRFIKNHNKARLSKLSSEERQTELTELATDEEYIKNSVQNFQNLNLLSPTEKKTYYERLLHQSTVDHEGASLRTKKERLIRDLTNIPSAPADIEYLLTENYELFTDSNTDCIDYHSALTPKPTASCDLEERQNFFTHFAELFSLEAPAAEALLTKIRAALKDDYSEDSFQNLSRSPLGEELRRAAQAALATHTAHNEALKKEHPFNLEELETNRTNLHNEIEAIPFRPATQEIAAQDATFLERLDAYLKGSIYSRDKITSPLQRAIAAMLSRELGDVSNLQNERLVGLIVSLVDLITQTPLKKRDEAITLAKEAVALEIQKEAISTTSKEDAYRETVRAIERLIEDSPSSSYTRQGLLGTNTSMKLLMGVSHDTVQKEARRAYAYQLPRALLPPLAPLDENLLPRKNTLPTGEELYTFSEDQLRTFIAPLTSITRLFGYPDNFYGELNESGICFYQVKYLFNIGWGPEWDAFKEKMGFTDADFKASTEPRREFTDAQKAILWEYVQKLTPQLLLEGDRVTLQALFNPEEAEKTALREFNERCARLFGMDEPAAQVFLTNLTNKKGHDATKLSPEQEALIKEQASQALTRAQDALSAEKNRINEQLQPLEERQGAVFNQLAALGSADDEN